MSARARIYQQGCQPYFYSFSCDTDGISRGFIEQINPISPGRINEYCPTGVALNLYPSLVIRPYPTTCILHCHLRSSPRL